MHTALSHACSLHLDTSCHKLQQASTCEHKLPQSKPNPRKAGPATSLQNSLRGYSVQEGALWPKRLQRCPEAASSSRTKLTGLPLDWAPSVQSALVKMLFAANSKNITPPEIATVRCEMRIASSCPPTTAVPCTVLTLGSATHRAVGISKQHHCRFGMGLTSIADVC